MGLNEKLAKSIYLFLQAIRREDIAGILAELEESQWHPTELLLQEQWGRFQEILAFAYDNIPFYRERLKRAGVEPGDIKCRDDLAAIPVLTKAEIKEHFDKLQAPVSGPVEKVRTSGSTGEPLVVMRCRSSTGYHRSNMFRQRRWFASDIGSFEGTFKTFNYPLRERLRTRLKDFILNRIRINERDLSEKNMLRFYQRLKTAEPKIFYGFPSLMMRFAHFLQEKGLDPGFPSLNAIIATGEMLYEPNKKFLAGLFGAPTVNEYGCSEVGIIALECPSGNWHVAVESCLVEILPGNDPEAEEGAGRVIVTDLWNQAMPIIRYENGDLAREKPGMCPCGRGLPTIESVTGRIGRMVDLPDGRSIHTITFSKIFKKAEDVAEASIREFQIRCRLPDQFEIVIVPDKNFNDDVLNHLRVRLEDALGPKSKIQFKLADEITATRNGKLEKFIIIEG